MVARFLRPKNSPSAYKPRIKPNIKNNNTTLDKFTNDINLDASKFLIKKKEGNSNFGKGYRLGEKNSYPSIRANNNLVAEASSKYINSNPGILDLTNRNKVIQEGILKLDPNLKTRSGGEVTPHVVGKNITKVLGYPNIPFLRISNNPAAIKKIDELVLNNREITGSAIKKELAKLDPKYEKLHRSAVSEYLLTNYGKQSEGLMRNFKPPKTSQEKLVRDRLKNKKKKELDDRSVSTGIERLRTKVLPTFKKIGNDQTSVLQGLHPALIANRTKPEGKITLSTPYRNNRHIFLENEAKKLMEQKNSIISNLDSNNMHLLSDVNNKLSNLNNQMSSLGLSSKLNNPRLPGDEYFGSIYPNLNTLYKSVKGPKGGIGPNVTGKDIPGFNMGGLISMLSRDELQGMAKSLSPKQVKMLTRQGPR